MYFVENSGSCNLKTKGNDFYSEKRKMVMEAWDLLMTRIEEFLPALYSCRFCDSQEQEIMYCQDCGPAAYYCYTCCMRIHKNILFHKPHQWKVLVNVVATVMNKYNSEIVDARGTLINKCTSIVADNTQQMELTLWKHHIDKVVVGKTYHFTNVSTRFFHTYTLTTTSSTNINDQEDLLEIADYQEESTSTITGAITQIILHKSAQCGNCHKSIKDIPTGNLVRCNSCNMKQLKSNLNNAYSCKMNVKDLSTSQVIKLNMFSSVLLTFLTENLKLNLLSEMEDVEDYLLEQQNLTITYNSNNKVVLKFQKTR
ncbi:unnamed protein product [Mytilus edulis]|uniref:Uncharacterized protein n=1 Tax=Mytilus edulis TaxID=6550 RepID=A0A8S3QAZ7_MYTED|nr:unnamed protein product [Mytilus edulis]